MLEGLARDSIHEILPLGLSDVASELAALLKVPSLRLALGEVVWLSAAEAKAELQPSGFWVTQRLSGQIEGKVAIYWPESRVLALLRRLTSDESTEGPGGQIELEGVLEMSSVLGGGLVSRLSRSLGAEWHAPPEGLSFNDHLEWPGQAPNFSIMIYVDDLVLTGWGVIAGDEAGSLESLVQSSMGDFLSTLVPGLV